MKEKFNDILDANENVLEVVKPNAKKYWLSMWLWIILWQLTIWGTTAVSLVLPFALEGLQTAALWTGIGLAVGLFLSTLIILWLAAIQLKNKYYAYTNKRILIRSGIFGIDYKSLEYKALTATIAQVSWLDKLVRQNTGSIQFGSPAAQIGGGWTNNGYYTNPYTFKHIMEPYVLLKKIKIVIEQLNS